MEERCVALAEGLEQVVDTLLETQGIGNVEDAVAARSDAGAPLRRVEARIKELRLDEVRDSLEDLFAAVAIWGHGSRFSVPQAIGREPSPTIVNPAQW